MGNLERHMAPYGDKRPLMDEVDKLKGQLKSALRELVTAKAQYFASERENHKLYRHLNEVSEHNTYLEHENRNMQMSRFQTFEHMIERDMPDNISVQVYDQERVQARAFHATVMVPVIHYIDDREYWGHMREEVIDELSRNLGSCISQYLHGHFEERFKCR